MTDVGEPSFWGSRFKRHLSLETTSTVPMLKMPCVLSGAQDGWVGSANTNSFQCLIPSCEADQLHL